MKKYIFMLFLAIYFILSIVACYGMQGTMLYKQIRQLLLPPVSFGIIRQQIRPDQSTLHALLELGIQGDDLTTVKFLLPLIDACYAAFYPRANCIARAKERIKTFKWLSQAIRQYQYQDPILPEFRRRYGRPSNILGMLRLHRDEQLFAAVHAGNLDRVNNLLKLGAYLTRIFSLDLDGCHINMNAFQMADHQVRQLSYETNPNPRSLQTAQAIMRALCSRRDTVFFTAIKNGNQLLVREMLALGASPTGTNIHGVTAIALAHQLAEQTNSRNLLPKRQTICTLLEYHLMPVELFAPAPYHPVEIVAPAPPPPMPVAAPAPQKSIAAEKTVTPQLDESLTKRAARLGARVFSPQVIRHQREAVDRSQSAPAMPTRKATCVGHKIDTDISDEEMAQWMTNMKSTSRRAKT